MSVKRIIIETEDGVEEYSGEDIHKWLRRNGIYLREKDLRLVAYDDYTGFERKIEARTGHITHHPTGPTCLGCPFRKDHFCPAKNPDISKAEASILDAGQMGIMDPDCPAPNGLMAWKVK